MDDDTLQTRYYLHLTAAFVIGRLGPIASDRAALFRAGQSAGLKLHKFKRTTLPRVQKVIGILKGICPDNLLDIGSGRGAFLWPLLETFPGMAVDAVDIRPQRVDDINAVHTGGVDRVCAHLADVTQLDFEESRFDVSCALEVLEHLPNPEAAVRTLIRVTQRFLLVSVPSKPDNNEEHIQLFTPDSLTHLLQTAGAAHVEISFVPGHLIAVAKVSHV